MTVILRRCLVSGDNRKNPYSSEYSTMYFSSGQTETQKYFFFLKKKTPVIITPPSVEFTSSLDEQLENIYDRRLIKVEKIQNRQKITWDTSHPWQSILLITQYTYYSILIRIHATGEKNVCTLTFF